MKLRKDVWKVKVKNWDKLKIVTLLNWLGESEIEEGCVESKSKNWDKLKIVTLLNWLGESEIEKGSAESKKFYVPPELGWKCQLEI